MLPRHYRTGERVEFPLTPEQEKQFADQRYNVKWEGAPNRWTTYALPHGGAVQIRPAACTLPACFCDAVWRDVPARKAVR